MSERRDRPAGWKAYQGDKTDQEKFGSLRHAAFYRNSARSPRRPAQNSLPSLPPSTEGKGDWAMPMSGLVCWASAPVQESPAVVSPRAEGASLPGMQSARRARAKSLWPGDARQITEDAMIAWARWWTDGS